MLICITADYTIIIAANLVLGVEINVTNAATFQLHHNILNSFDRRAEDDKVANDMQIPVPRHVGGLPSVTGDTEISTKESEPLVSPVSLDTSKQN